MTENFQKPISIYLHIPFCLRKCPYCDFFSIPQDSKHRDIYKIKSEYGNLLSREINLLTKEFSLISQQPLLSIYLGGGTPSLLEPEDYCDFFKEIEKIWKDFRNAEITLEANPETLTEQKIDKFINLGINRISLGVQSLSDVLLGNLKRPHNTQKSLDVINLLKKSGEVKNFNLDLIFGIPDQTFLQWKDTLSTVLNLSPPHLSIYGLTIHPETPFYDMMVAGNLNLPSEETQAEMFLFAREFLTNAGYIHYEISNYALPGQESKHNKNYWLGGEYLGLGAGAHSFIRDTHFYNPEDLPLYRNKILKGELPFIKEETLTKEELLKERIMLALRTIKGINTDEFNKKYECDFMITFKKEINNLLTLRLIELKDRRIYLTKQGLLLADEVVAYFF